MNPAARWHTRIRRAAGLRHAVGLNCAVNLKCAVGLRCVVGLRHSSSVDTLHAQQLSLQSPPELTYPPDSVHLNPQHFHQVSIRRWLERDPRPLSIAELVGFTRQMSRQKVLASANHVAEELTIRFAHRLRSMQLLPYRLMSHPALLNCYEQYMDSFEMLRRIGTVHTLEDNEQLIKTSQNLLEKHTQVVTNMIFGMRDLLSRPHKEGDEELLNDLVKALLTSRLSRRVLVKQHALVTREWQRSQESPLQADRNRVGEFVLDCRIVDALDVVEHRAKATLSRIFAKPVEQMPAVLVEGTPDDLAATFPYIKQHFEFALGELLFNSLEACLRQNTTDPIVVTVSATKSSVLVRISDRAGGLNPAQEHGLWSFANSSDASTVITPQGLANHQFFSLLFPAEELPAHTEYSAEPDSSHYSLGLALSRLYVEYWGGALELHSLPGFGCDALLRVSRTGRNRENLLLT